MIEKSAAVVAVLCLLLAASSTEATEYIVDPSGAGHFTTVQEAVDVAHNGDTIRIRAGHYLENVLSVGKYLTYIGEGSGATILEAAVSGPTVRIEDMPNPTPSVFEDLTVIRHAASTSAVSWNVGYAEFRNVDIVGWLVGGTIEQYDEAWVGLWDSTVTGVKMRGGWYAHSSTITGSSVGEVRLYGVSGFEWTYYSCLSSSSSQYGAIRLYGGFLNSNSDVIAELIGDSESGCAAVGSELPSISWQSGQLDIYDCHVAGDLTLSAWLPSSMNPGADPRVVGCLIEGGLSVFTLTTHAPENNINYLTMDEGVASGQLVIQELKNIWFLSCKLVVQGDYIVSITK